MIQISILLFQNDPKLQSMIHNYHHLIRDYNGRIHYLYYQIAIVTNFVSKCYNTLIYHKLKHINYTTVITLKLTK